MVKDKRKGENNMFKSETLKKVLELENAINNANDCIKYFYQSGNLEEIEAYKTIRRNLYKELRLAYKAHRTFKENQSSDVLVYSC